MKLMVEIIIVVSIMFIGSLSFAYGEQCLADYQCSPVECCYYYRCEPYDLCERRDLQVLSERNDCYSSTNCQGLITMAVLPLITGSH